MPFCNFCDMFAFWRRCRFVQVENCKLTPTVHSIFSMSLSFHSCLLLVWVTAKRRYRSVSYMQHPFDIPRLKQHQFMHLIFVVPCIMLYSSETSPTRCNNCVLILRNDFTLHVSGDNLTHHQEYICCIWPQVSRLT